MLQTTVKVSGMACSMCEAHVNDTIRRAFSVEKVSSSHAKAIVSTGYTAGEIHAAPYEKKGLFSFLKK